MNVVQVGDRTRLVLNLRSMVPYESKIEGNSFRDYPGRVRRARAGPRRTPGAARFAEGRVGRSALAAGRQLPAGTRR